MPLAVGLVAFLAFGVIAPIRGSLPMGKVVVRALVTAVIALLVAGLAAAVASLVTLLLGLGAHAVAGGADRLLETFGRLVVNTAAGQLAGQLVVLLAVPFGALLLWGWLRREPDAPEV